MKRNLQDERGQTMVITVMFLVILLGFCALVLDVGHAYLAQRRLAVVGRRGGSCRG